LRLRPRLTAPVAEDVAAMRGCSSVVDGERARTRLPDLSLEGSAIKKYVKAREEEEKGGQSRNTQGGGARAQKRVWGRRAGMDPASGLGAWIKLKSTRGV
jgi:hypothetical protein